MTEQYCACCVDDEEVNFYGLGSSPDEAYCEFIQSGQFENQCDDFCSKTGSEIEVYIYTIVDPDKSDWPDDERDPEWAFVLDEKIETRTAIAPHSKY